jgi:hypothetical protein
MPFKVFRDCGEWSAYECGAEWGGFATREEVEVEVRRHQRADHESAETCLIIAKAKLRKAKETLAKPVRVDLMRTGSMKVRVKDSLFDEESG